MGHEKEVLKVKSAQELNYLYEKELIIKKEEKMAQIQASIALQNSKADVIKAQILLEAAKARIEAAERRAAIDEETATMKKNVIYGVFSIIIIVVIGTILFFVVRESSQPAVQPATGTIPLVGF